MRFHGREQWLFLLEFLLLRASTITPVSLLLGSVGTGFEACSLSHVARRNHFLVLTSFKIRLIMVDRLGDCVTRWLLLLFLCMALPERAPGYDIAKEEPKKESQANCKMKIAISRLIRGQTTIFKFNEQVIDESHAIYVDGNERRSTDDESGDRLKISCVFCLLVDLNFQEV